METVSCPLMQQMASIGMDWNLKKFGPTFSSFNAAIPVSLMKFVLNIFPYEICLISRTHQ